MNLECFEYKDETMIERLVNNNYKHLVVNWNVPTRPAKLSTSITVIMYL